MPSSESQKQRSKDYYWRNREEILRKKKQYYSENPELIKERHKNRYEKHNNNRFAK